MILLAGMAAIAACGGPDEAAPTPAPPATALPQACEIAAGAPAPDFLRRLGCQGDFDALASEPLDASIPGARATKVVIDTLDGDALYFQNSKKYKIHHQFASAHLSGNGRPIVPGLMRFNETEYTSSTRRFLLGSITYYEAAKIWAFEIAPYDTASDRLIARTYDAIARATFFGKELVFHPTSTMVERAAALLPPRVKVKTTGDLFEKIDYQPLNLASAMGKLRFVRAQELDTEYLSFREIVVLDHVPNDISVVAGIVTEEFQTPLSHINVLSQNRRTPNMGLRSAFMDARLRKHEGAWVRLTVGATAFSIEPVTQADADRWWEANKPKGVMLPKMDTSVTGLVDVKQVLDPMLSLKDGLKKALPAFGGKATHYAAMAAANLVPLPRPGGFVIPVHYYAQFITQNGFDKRVDALLADDTFRGDVKLRDQKLKALRGEMEDAPVDAELEKLLTAKLAAEYANTPMRYRSSSTAEDLDGFAGAGLYTSKTGDPNDQKKTALRAIKRVWASVWYFRGFEERDYRSVDQKGVGMAILAHPSFPEEEATGVALTANPFDPSGLQPGFFINVQPGDESVTLPEAGVHADQILYHFKLPGQPIVYLDHSNKITAGQTVLTPRQIFALGSALDKIHEFFRPAYGPAPGSHAWYALEVDFKFDGPPGKEPELFIKQARPHPGRGMVTLN
jgi:hypothetical protein